MNRLITGLLMIVIGACYAGNERAAMEEILAADRAFAQATAEGGVEGWVSYFADDGVMISGGGEVAGGQAVRELMSPAFADSSFSLTWEPIRGEVSEANDLGYTIGRYESRRVGDAGDTTFEKGLYVTIWRKQVDGSWRVALDIGDSEEAAPSGS